MLHSHHVICQAAKSHVITVTFITAVTTVIPHVADIVTSQVAVIEANDNFYLFYVICLIHNISNKRLKLKINIYNNMVTSNCVYAYLHVQIIATTNSNLDILY